MSGRRLEDDPLRGRRVMSDREWRILARAIGLSTREREIARRVFDDFSEVAIADDLGISPHTVHTHLERLYHKTGVGSRCALVVRLFGEFRRLQRAEVIRESGPSGTGSVERPTPDEPSVR